MSLVSTFISWANATFFQNNRRLITGENANSLAHKIADTFVTKDAPIPRYGFTVQQTQLDENNSVVITHNLNTIVPGILCYDENDYPVGLAVCKSEPLTANTIRLTFYDDIPATGNGVYRFVLFAIIDDVPLPFVPPVGEIFNEDFSTWVDYDLAYLYPEDWSDEADFDSNYPDIELINSSNRLQIHKSFSTVYFRAIAPYTLKIKRYRLKFYLAEGTLKVGINDLNFYYFTVPGWNQIDFLPPAAGSTRRIYFENYIDNDVIIDNITIYPLE